MSDKKFPPRLFIDKEYDGQFTAYTTYTGQNPDYVYLSLQEHESLVKPMLESIAKYSFELEQLTENDHINSTEEYHEALFNANRRRKKNRKTSPRILLQSHCARGEGMIETHELKIVQEALVWCLEMLKARDKMNSKVHCAPVTYSPIVDRVQRALTLIEEGLKK